MCIFLYACTFNYNLSLPPYRYQSDYYDFLHQNKINILLIVIIPNLAYFKQKMLTLWHYIIHMEQILYRRNVVNNTRAILLLLSKQAYH